MKRILLVEDNPLDRKLIHSLLKENLGIEVVIDEAADGMDALEILANNYYDLIITDLIMPNIEGIELISRLKTTHPKCKIIAISGSNPYYLTMAKKLGIHSVFTKPINKNKFLDTIINVLTMNILLSDISLQ